MSIVAPPSAGPAALRRRDFATRSGVRLDRFQTLALDALDSGLSVLCAAPTGAGKTLVADYAVEAALATGGKAFYTTPLKALSNQKLRDLAARHGTDRVGMITGDLTVRPHAPVVVMTTEVLRALLHDRSALLEGLQVVVLDEVHYLQDPERGPVWEEVVIHCPSSVTLVALSATMAEAPAVAQWMSDVHGPTACIVEDRRPIALQHLYAVGSPSGEPPLLLPVHVDGRVSSSAELLDGTRRRTRGDGLRVRQSKEAQAPSRLELVDHLRRSNLVPAIWFVLSRDGCDAAVTDLVDAGVRLVDESDVGRVRRIAQHHLAALGDGDLRAIRYAEWMAGLSAGVAAHHSGLLPAQREAVEECVAEGLVKVVFATETLALGLNLPARTVVVDRVLRAGGRSLTSGEFAQLAGRAGRRGLDDVGYVIVPWAKDVPFHRVAALTDAGPSPLVSHFRPTPAMTANLVRTFTPDEAEASVRRSLAEHLRRRTLADLRPTAATARAAAVEAAAEAASVAAPAQSDGAEADVASAGEDPAAVLAAVAVGDVIIDPGRKGAVPAIVVAPPRERRRQVVVDTVRGDGRRVVVTSTELRRAPVVVAHVDLPEWAPNERGHAKVAGDVLRDLLESGAVATVLRPPPPPPERRRANEDPARLAAVAAELEAQVDALEHQGVDELDASVRLLRRLSHVDGWTLTDSGSMVRRLFHASCLITAGALADGLFDDLGPADVAALASCFTAPPGVVTLGGSLPRALRDRWPAVQDIVRRVQRAEGEEGLPPTRDPSPHLALAVHRWASGADLDGALAGTDVRAGDLVREIRQAAELLEQVADARPALLDVVVAAQAALLRGAAVRVAELEVLAEADDDAAG